MKKIRITKDDYDRAMKSEYKRMRRILEHQIIKVKSSLNTEIPINNIETRYINILDSALANGLISVISSSINIQWIDPKKPNYQLVGFYLRMITSHMRIIEDFEFYNIALIIKYYLEACAGIIQNKDNITEHFKDLTYKQYEERLLKYNFNITKKINKILGAECGYIYHRVSAFSHPFWGSVYGLNTVAASKRDSQIIAWLLKSYEICSILIFKIFNINLDLNFLEFIYKNYNIGVYNEIQNINNKI